jgi:acyl carrier protein
MQILRLKYSRNTAPRVYINLVVSRYVNTSHSKDYAVIGAGKVCHSDFHGATNAIGCRMFARVGIILKDETQDPGIRMSVRATVAAQFEQVAFEQKRKLARLSDDLKLLESGLDSLSFALIVVRLEESLGFDPFDAPEQMYFPVTFGDFVRLYESRGK